MDHPQDLDPFVAYSVHHDVWYPRHYELASAWFFANAPPKWESGLRRAWIADAPCHERRPLWSRLGDVLPKTTDVW